MSREPLPFDALVLANGCADDVATSVSSVRGIVRRVRVLEPSLGMIPAVRNAVGAEGDVVVDHCDWQDDDAAKAATGSGVLHLLILGAGETLELPDEDQIRRWCASEAVPDAVEVSVPGGWEARIVRPGPDAADRIGAPAPDRVHSLRITQPGVPQFVAPTVPACRTRPSGSSPRPYIIVTPGYDPKSGGIAVLHSLCDRLNRLGYEAGLCLLDESGGVHPRWRTPLATRAQLAEGIVVYPEIVVGNPLEAPRVVRWMLNRVGYINGADNQAGEDDVLYVISSILDPELPVLWIPAIDPGVFFPKDVPGSGALLWRGKATAEGDIDTSGMTEITRTWPAEKKALAEVFRRADVLYSFDSLSAINSEATLCGTPVVLFPDRRWARTDLERCESGLTGMTWDADAGLEQARAEVGGAYERYLTELALVDRNVEAFALDTQARFE